MSENQNREDRKTEGERERWNPEREQEVEEILVIEKKRLTNRDEQMVKE